MIYVILNVTIVDARQGALPTLRFMKNGLKKRKYPANVSSHRSLNCTLKQMNQLRTGNWGYKWTWINAVLQYTPVYSSPQISLRAVEHLWYLVEGEIWMYSWQICASCVMLWSRSGAKSQSSWRANMTQDLEYVCILFLSTESLLRICLYLLLTDGQFHCYYWQWIGLALS